MRTKLTVLSICAVALSGAAVTASAQQQPTPFPWEKNTDRFFERKLPKVENPIDKSIERGLKSLGLPKQPTLDTTNQNRPATKPPVLSDTVLPRLDANRDGAVSRSEYILKRQRGATAGSEGTASYVRRYRRLDSRFRTADQNRDGRLSASEIDAMEGRRF